VDEGAGVVLPELRAIGIDGKERLPVGGIDDAIGADRRAGDSAGAAFELLDADIGHQAGEGFPPDRIVTDIDDAGCPGIDPVGAAGGEGGGDGLAINEELDVGGLEGAGRQEGFDVYPLASVDGDIGCGGPLRENGGLAFGVGDQSPGIRGGGVVAPVEDGIVRCGGGLDPGRDATSG
jgi:hypothetical protein